MQLFYDLEIINLIQRDPRFPRLKSCGGWTDFANMGISVCGFAINARPVECALFDDSVKLPMFRRQDFESLVTDATQVIGFNSTSFDDNLMFANGINIRTTFDLLEQVRISAYGSPAWQDCPRGCTYKLDALAQANLDYRKTGSGELAPVLWQQGKYQEVIEYCKNDVRILRDLYYLFLQGKLKDPNNGKILIPSF